MWFFQIVLNRLGRIWRTNQSENPEKHSHERCEEGFLPTDRLRPVSRAETTHIKRPRKRGCDLIQETASKA